MHDGPRDEHRPTVLFLSGLFFSKLKRDPPLYDLNASHGEIGMRKQPLTRAKRAGKSPTDTDKSNSEGKMP